MRDPAPLALAILLAGPAAPAVAGGEAEARAQFREALALDPSHQGAREALSALRP